jgi:hypothetical protein
MLDAETDHRTGSGPKAAAITRPAMISRIAKRLRRAAIPVATMMGLLTATGPARAVSTDVQGAPMTVAVIGDSIARQYCRGLKRHIGRDPHYVVECWAHPSSGLTRDDFLDWDKRLSEYLSDERPDVAIVSMGANDAQQMTLPDRVVPFADPAWAEVYAARVDGIIRRLEDDGATVIWVGLPIPRSDVFARKLERLNAIYQTQAAATGARFLPMWRATQDSEGRFAPALPDAKGRLLLAREDDGVHYTRDGETLIACKLLGALPGVASAHELSDGC